MTLPMDAAARPVRRSLAAGSPSELRRPTINWVASVVIVGTAADMVRAKGDLIAENALLRQQVVTVMRELADAKLSSRLQRLSISESSNPLIVL